MLNPSQEWHALILLIITFSDSTIFFHIELVDFLWEAPITTVFNSNDTFGEFEKVAADMKAEGNRLCKENKWSEAAARY